MLHRMNSGGEVSIKSLNSVGARVDVQNFGHVQALCIIDLTTNQPFGSAEFLKQLSND